MSRIQTGSRSMDKLNRKNLISDQIYVRRMTEEFHEHAASGANVKCQRSERSSRTGSERLTRRPGSVRLQRRRWTSPSRSRHQQTG